MQVKEVLFIVNPESGKKRGVKDASKAASVLKSYGYESNIFLTESRGHATELISNTNLSRYEFVVGVGGDGTCHELVNGLMRHDSTERIPLGMLPSGSGNSLMHDLHCLNIEEAIEKLIQKKTMLIDVMEVLSSNKKYYAFNIVGWGFAAEINTLAESYRWMGGQRYNILSLFQILKNPSWNVEISIDGNSYSEAYSMVLLCNNIHTGKGMRAAPKAQMDDGLIDLIAIKSLSRSKLISLFSKIFSGKHINDPSVDYRQIKELSLVTNQTMTLNLDGEVKGKSPMIVSVVNKAIELIV